MLKLKKRIFLVGGVISVILTAHLLLVNIAKADTSSPWLLPTSLNLQKQADLSVVPTSINGNIDCYTEDNATCTIDMPYGSANSSTGIKLNNTSQYLPVISYIDNHQHFLAIPNSNTTITYTTEPVDGLYLYFNYNFSSSITKNNNGLGAYYQIDKPPDGRLADKDNHRLAADYTSASFSENGEWMIVGEPNVAMLRVNLRTFEVLPFAAGFNYTIGLSPSLQTAITNDGRYAVVASKDFNRFSIYDLATCSEVPSTITGPANCQSRDLQTVMQAKVEGYNNVSHLRFISDDTLSLYASYTQSSVKKTAKYILSDADGLTHQQDYLAVGDSYISGEGAFNYLQGTDTGDNLCHLSRQSYPLLLGADLNYNSYHSVACSGATTEDIIDTSDSYISQANPKKTKQQRVNDVPYILSNFQPGYIDQLDFVKQYQPKVITISVAGNDIGFSSRLRDCLGIGTCYDTYEDRLEFVQEVNRTLPKLVSTYSTLKTASAPDTRIYVVGYPQIAKVGGDCALNVHMNNDELAFAQQAISYLDQIISVAASRAGVFYVDSQNSLDGHRLCEAGPGSVAVNGLTAGNDIPGFSSGPIGNESYHPNAFGHQLFENKILAATHNLTGSMPAPNPSANLPAQDGLDILNAPHSGRTIDTTEFDPSLSADFNFQQTPIDVTIDGAAHSLAPSTTLSAEIHSTTIGLGQYTTDNNGDLIAQITIPASVPAGYHTIHFYGTDITGQSIDIFKDIYIAASADDLDGNGRPDSDQKCVGVGPSGQDFDHDGVDDACDANISLPAVNTPAQADFTGSISSATTQLGVSNNSTSQNSNSSKINVSSSVQTQSSQPKVLGSEISNPEIIAQNNLRLQPKYFAYGLAAFLLFSALVTLLF